VKVASGAVVSSTSTSGVAVIGVVGITSASRPRIQSAKAAIASARRAMSSRYSSWVIFFPAITRSRTHGSMSSASSSMYA
jgi:hypothetical protein